MHAVQSGEPDSFMRWLEACLIALCACSTLSSGCRKRKPLQLGFCSGMRSVWKYVSDIDGANLAFALGSNN